MTKKGTQYKNKKGKSTLGAAPWFMEAFGTASPRLPKKYPKKGGKVKK